MIYANHKQEGLSVERFPEARGKWVSLQVSLEFSCINKASSSTYFVLRCRRWRLADLVNMKVCLHKPAWKLTFSCGESHAKNIFCVDALMYEFN